MIFMFISLINSNVECILICLFALSMYFLVVYSSCLILSFDFLLLIKWEVVYKFCTIFSVFIFKILLVSSGLCNFRREAHYNSNKHCPICNMRHFIGYLRFILCLSF